MKNIETDDRFVALINAAVDGIFIISFDGIIEVVNHAGEEMFGYKQFELVNQNINTLMASPYKEKHDSYINSYHDTGKGNIIGIGREIEAQRKDGSNLQIYLSVGKYGDGQGVKFIGIIRDLSDVKQNEANLENAELEIHDLVNRLAQVSRIGVMGEMAASIAHEINQPLTAISAYAQACSRLLMSEDRQASDVITALEKISKQAMRAGEIIRGLRTWINERDTQRETSDCNALITEVVDIARMEARNSNIELRLDMEPTVHMIICDPIQIQQVALNLIKNSIDSLTESPVQQSKIRQEILVDTRYIEGGRIQVTVTDRGAGISEAAADRLFSPFFTTKKNGMGMGLSICKTIIRAHGGELFYQAIPQGGVSFSFILPTSVEAE